MTTLKTIHELTELAEVPATADEIPVYDATAGLTLRNTRKNFLGYTEYVALLAQTGTAAPTATVIKNDTGATASYAYSGLGAYTITFSTAVLTANKTIVLLGETTASHKGAVIASTTLVILSVSGPDGINANNLLAVTPIIIRIYV